jgi:protein phosphatase 1 regulatory subunit 21
LNNLFFKDIINEKDQNLRRNDQEIETLSFLNNQLKSRLEVLKQELNDMETHTKLKKSNSNKISQFYAHNDSVLAQELEQKIKQYETIQRRVSFILSGKLIILCCCCRSMN